MALHNKISVLLEHILNVDACGSEPAIERVLESAGVTGADLPEKLLSVDYPRREVIDQIAKILDFSFDEYLKTARPYLTSEEVREMIRRGFTIGAHSIDHPLYSALPLEEQLRQTRVSVRVVRQMFSLPYGAFAFPHGDRGVSGAFFSEVFSDGAIDVSFGTGGIIRDVHPKHFHRFSMEYNPVCGRTALKQHYARSAAKTFIGRGIVKRPDCV
jgi:hypothetical protein